MKRALILPGGTATEQLELAELAEATGWEGVFVWEAAFGIDAWTLLAATLLLRMRWDDRPRGCR